MCKTNTVIRLLITIIATLSLIFLTFPASANGLRWYGLVQDDSINPSAGQITQKVVDSTIDPTDAANKGFVVHPLWLLTRVGSSGNSWVEVGYGRQPYNDASNSYYYSASGTPSTYAQDIRDDLPPARIGYYSDFAIWWDSGLKKWVCDVNGMEIGEWANIGVSSGVRLDAGIESTSYKNYSPPATVYNLEFATLNNWTWRAWPSPYISNNSPANFRWTNPPLSGESSINYYAN